MLPFGGSFLLTLNSLFSVVLLPYCTTVLPPYFLLLGFFSFLYPLENSSRKIHFAPLSGFFYQNCQSRFTFLYFFFWALESFASLFWLAVAVSTSKLFLLLYVSHCLADMQFYIRIFIFICVFLFLYLSLLLLGCGSQPHFWMETQN